MFFGAKVDRDPEINKLRQNVEERLWDIVQESTPKEEQQPKEEIRFVSFEDALKELVSLKNS